MATEPNALVRRMLGGGWNARNPARVMQWAGRQAEFMASEERQAFEEVVLKGRSPGEVAAELGIAPATMRDRVRVALKNAGALARSLSKERFKGLFASVYEHEFGEEVSTAELTKVLFGYYDRRSTQELTAWWIPRAQRGEIPLPAPQKKGKGWVWTKAQADQWRDWFAKRDGDVDAEKEQARAG